MYTYEQLRRLAVQSGIPDNKVSIGFWIRSKGLKKIKKQVDKVRKIYYIKILESKYCHLIKINP